jgi:hypothetical protein
MLAGVSVQWCALVTAFGTYVVLTAVLRGPPLDRRWAAQVTLHFGNLIHQNPGHAFRFQCIYISFMLSPSFSIDRTHLGFSS